MRPGGAAAWDGTGGVFSENRSKAWCERFFLAYSPVWIVWALLGLVQTGYYKYLESPGYLGVGLAAALPCFVVPLFVVGEADSRRPLLDRFWVKANVWVAVYSFIGNYFWTHYFYTVLGTGYTLPSYDLNDVPIVMYLLTHAYFCLYHALANLVLRAVARLCDRARCGVAVKRSAQGASVFALAYVTAFMETLTISNFEYYTFVDKAAMYTVGSLFYAIYFFVSFPMFYRIEEVTDRAGRPLRKWTVWECFLDAMAAGMMVTILLDLWRLALGAIWTVGGAGAATATGGGAGGLPWLAGACGRIPGAGRTMTRGTA